MVAFIDFSNCAIKIWIRLICVGEYKILGVYPYLSSS